MQKYINFSSSDWSATWRIYIFGNILNLDLDLFCSTNAMGALEKLQYGCNLFSNKQGTIYGFYVSYLQSWLFGSYLQQSVNRKRDSAQEDVGGLGSGENLFCQWPVHQSRHELAPPVEHFCPLCFISSHWSLRRRDQGGQPGLVSSLLRLHIGSSLLAQFIAVFLHQQKRV